jgi:hypothetical protein
MKSKTNIYKDFNGYNAYPLAEAEKIIRNRLLDVFSTLIEKIEGCIEKAKNMRLIKILEHILAVKKRMGRMKSKMKERDNIFVPAYLKARIAHVDEEKLKTVDFRLIELVDMNREILDELSCAEADTHIIDKFTRINENLREMETHCHSRALLLKKEIF